MGGNEERTLGIDPGTVHTGWGVIELQGGSLIHVAHGTIGSSANQGQAARLSRIYHGLQEAIVRYRPNTISLEKIFFARNPQSALKLGQARGVALLAAAENDIDLQEYTPDVIKQAVVGYGHASKLQMQKMVGSLLHLSNPIGTDAADALAAAICHLHQRSFHSSVAAAASPRRQEGRPWSSR